MKIARIEHIAIAVSDMTAFKKMLESVFDLRMAFEHESANSSLALYPIAGTFLVVVQGKHEASRASQWVRQNGPSLFHLGLRVDDLEAALAEAREKQVKLLDERPRPGHGGSLIAFLDPQSTGNVLIELVQAGQVAD